MTLETSTEPAIELPAITASITGDVCVVGFDPEDPDSSRWFLADSVGSTVVSGSEVIPYIRSSTLYPDIVSAMRTATSSEHFILLAGWNLSDATTHYHGPGPDFALVPGDATTSLRSLFGDASTAGARIRVMLFKHDTGSDARDNSELVRFINGLANGVAIHDEHVVAGLRTIGPHLPGSHHAGAHHQKIIVVWGSEGLVAFQGGFDLDPDRISLARGPGMHDVHTRIRGSGAKALADAFMQRWNDHPSVTAAQQLTFVPRQAPHPDNKLVQLVRTFPNVAHHPLNGGGTNTFAPLGDDRLKQLLLRAIGAARRFIYVEDQYLFDMDISNALRAALPSIQKLIILIVASESIERETLQPWARRKEFIDNLPATYTITPATGGPTPTPAVATYSGKVAVCQLTTQYVHAKTWIFDDKFAVIGSANINRRGMTHDSEQACGIFDANAGSRWFFAHELRMHLWAKHLGGSPIDYHGPIGSSVHWFRPIGGVQSYNPDGGVDADPSGSSRSGVSPFNLWWAGITSDVVWDEAIDPDGT